MILAKKTKIDFKGAEYYLLGLFAAVPLLRIAGVSAYVWLLFGLAIRTIGLRDLQGLKSCELLPLTAVYMLSLVYAGFSGVSSAYLGNAIKATATLTALVISVSSYSFKDSRGAYKVLEGVMLGAKINAVWIILQSIAWQALEIDLNELVFSEWLCMSDQTTQTDELGLVPTGLCWNAGGIAAAIVFGIGLAKNSGWRLAITIAGALTRSGTILVGIILSYVLIVVVRNSDGVKYAVKIIRKHPLVSVVIGLSFFCAIAIALLIGVLPQLDWSASVHMSYYRNIPQLLSNMNPFNLLLGYGPDCSGMPYTALTDQYWWLDSWFVESDTVNALLGTGIVGLCCYVLTYIYYIRTALHRSPLFAGIVIILFLLGFLYNLFSVTYYWGALLLHCLVNYEESMGSFGSDFE